MKERYIISKRLLNYAFLLEILAGVLLFIVTQDFILSCLLVGSGILFLLSGNMFNKEDE